MHCATGNSALGSILDIIFASLEHDHEALRASNRVLLSTLDREISQSLFLHVSTPDDNGYQLLPLASQY